MNESSGVESAQTRIAPLLAEDGRASLNIFRTLAHNKALLKAFLHLGTHLLSAEVLPERERELVILRVGWRAQAEYEFGQHRGLGLGAGLSEAEIIRLTGDALGEWTPADRALVAMVDELCAQDMVTDVTWAALASRWSEAELLELLVLAGYYRLVSGLLNSVGVALEAGTPGWPEGARPIRRAPRLLP